MKHLNKTSEKEKRRKLRRNQTFCEKVVWLHLRNRRMLGYKFRRQYSVDKFVIDFYCPELKLAIEIDGSVHDNPENLRYDRRRQKYIEQFGIVFLRIKNSELLGNENLMFKRIEQTILELKSKKANNRKSI
jgi:very-short-patch-repair endonuclease